MPEPVRLVNGLPAAVPKAASVPKPFPSERPASRLSALMPGRLSSGANGLAESRELASTPAGAPTGAPLAAGAVAAAEAPADALEMNDAAAGISMLKSNV